MEEERIYSIIVNVPKIEKTCFVVMPFNPELDEIYLAIKDAAIQVGLRPIRTDTNLKLDFANDIIYSIRCANLIVAVCSPIGNIDGKEIPNPNVMYELGMAHALGKPTLILTTSPNSLPTNIITKNAIPYKKYEVGDMERRTNLTDKIKSKMDDVLKGVTNFLVDREWEKYDIWLACTKHKMCLKPEFLDAFKTIVSFGDNIQKYFHPIDSESIQLRKQIENIVLYVIDDLAITDQFNNTWGSYSRYYDTAKLKFFNNLNSSLEEVETSINSLLNMADDDYAREHIRATSKYYSVLKNGLNSYVGLHQETIGDTGGVFTITLQDPSSAAKLLTRIQQLANKTGSFLAQSHKLMENLIKIIT